MNVLYALFCVDFAFPPEGTLQYWRGNKHFYIGCTFAYTYTFYKKVNDTYQPAYNVDQKERLVINFLSSLFGFVSLLYQICITFITETLIKSNVLLGGGGAHL